MTFKELKDKLKQEKETKDGFIILSICFGLLFLFSLLCNFALYSQKNMWRETAMEQLKPKPVSLESVFTTPQPKTTKAEDSLQLAIEQAKGERELAKLRLEAMQFEFERREITRSK